MKALASEPHHDGDEPILATRFDYSMNNNYYILNLDVDEKGEHIEAKSNMQGRVVSKTPIEIQELPSSKAHVKSVDIDEMMNQESSEESVPRDSVPL